MNDLDPLWLRSFVAIAKTGSVTRAAQQVHRTQSAVSTHLQQLEASVGARLAHRTTRALTLTEAGERFLPHARRLLDLQDEARASVRPEATTAVRRIGLSEYFLPSRLESLLALLQGNEPGARFELLWSSSATLQRLWSAGEMDLAVVTSDAPLPGARLLRREALSWVSAPGLALPPQGSLPLALLGTDCPVRAMAMASMARMRREHHLQLSCTGSHGAVAAIRAGWGIGCLNTSAIPPDLTELSRLDPRRWPSPGRLSFYALTRAALRGTERALRAWSA